jgi:hypothetical protein
LPASAYWVIVRRMSDDTGPRLVSENSEAQIDRERSAATASWSLRDLASNLLRVIRGAGKPEDIVRQIDELVRVLVAYKDATGQWPPPHELAAMLDIDRTESLRATVKDGELHRLYAQEQIIRGALQQAASRLVGQTTQASAGAHEMHDGIRELEEARAEIRREWNTAHPLRQNIPSKRVKASARKKSGAAKS